MADSLLRGDPDLLARALRGESLPRPPVWLMRQAGRSDPEYNRLKEQAALPLESLFRHPGWAARLSLLPQRFGVDAIIFFQDILTPLAPMGCEFVFRPGPVTDKPIRTPAGLSRLSPIDPENDLAFVGETLGLIRERLAGALPVLGFAGAPLTLLVFMVEGKSFGARADAALTFLSAYPHVAHELLERLTEMTIAYLQYQAKAGAAAVQLFESAACLFSPDQYVEFALPYQQRIFNALRGTIPTIVFARDWPQIADLGAAGADVVSLPSSSNIAAAREILGDGAIVQGNLDNRLLATGPWSEIALAARACIESGGRRGHIFNLSHGLMRETPFEHVTRLIRLVHESR